MEPKTIQFVTLFLLINFAVNIQQIYSQGSEEPDSINCKDNNDQSLYVSNVSLQNNPNSSKLITNDLPGFHYVKKFDSNGTLISAWGTKGIGQGQFLHAHGIAVDSEGNVYVSDAEKCNIQKFDSEGNFITMWGAKGTGPGKFFQPESMALDSQGNIFVADYANHYIQKFDSDGNFITMWGAKGRGDGQFEKLWGVAVDSNDNVYTSDQKNKEIKKFSNDGKFLAKWNSYSLGRLFVHLHDIAIDSNDSIYVTDGRNNSRVAKFNTQGDFITQWGAFGSGNGRFIEDHGIAVDSDGNAYVVDTRNVRIQKFNSQAEYVTKWGLLGCRDDQFLIPHDIAIDSSGNVYVTDSGNVHFLAADTCHSFDSKDWATTFRKVLTSTMSGDNQIPPVDTNLVGIMAITIPQNETEIEYKINITGTSNISSAYLHLGKNGENGNEVVDLLNDSKINKMEESGIAIRGEILGNELMGPFKGKALDDLILAMTDGTTYVNISTPSHPKGEIRGQIHVSDSNTGN